MTETKKGGGDFMRYYDQQNRTMVMRLWEKVAEKFCALRPEKDESDPNLYRLFGANGACVVSVRVEAKHWEEGSYCEVRIMDADGALLVKENVFSALLPGPRHPLEELIAFLCKPINIVTPEVSALQKLLA
ncbi:MAG: hypothetical protein HYY55_01330 [Candidatus Niyogibacteria bacterium]|nr:MAG: hypothetical protein HYY55_01330 [Candidatus Niyogibacteria bacterium]